MGTPARSERLPRANSSPDRACSATNRSTSRLINPRMVSRWTMSPTLSLLRIPAEPRACCGHPSNASVAGPREARVRWARESGGDGPMAIEGRRTMRIGPTVGTVKPLGSSGARLLSNVPLFAGLSARDLRRVAGLAEETWFNPGRVVVQEGKPGSSFYAVILDGTARVTRRGRTIRKLGPGDYFGELALLTGGPRTASVIAETSLDTIRIQRSAFRKLLLKEPEVALRIMAGLAERIAECERQLPG